jgi:hypothetical protein
VCPVPQAYRQRQQEAEHPASPEVHPCVAVGCLGQLPRKVDPQFGQVIWAEQGQ